MNSFPTIAALKNSPVARLNKHLFEEKQVKKSKYGNEIIEFNGFSFRSKKELARYVVLRMKQTVCEIGGLQLQVPFELNDGGTHSLKYVCDFLYKEIKSGEIICEDTKGKCTKLFKKKAKLMKKLFNITVKLT